RLSTLLDTSDACSAVSLLPCLLPFTCRVRLLGGRRRRTLSFSAPATSTHHTRIVFIGFECLIVSVKFEFITSSPRNPVRGLPHALCGTTVADPQQILRGCPHQSPTASSPSRPSQTAPLDSTQATDRSEQ
ncbi:Alkaline/neutral invertase A mitochondrial, partial [Zea mays]